MKKVAWPPRAGDHELDGRSCVIGVVVMTALIFVFDWLAGGAVNHIFK